MKGKIIKRAASFGAALVLVFIVLTFFFNRGMTRIYALEINAVDLSKVDDGEYNGKYCEGRWCYDLNVVVSEHKITAITLNDDTMKLFSELHAVLTTRIIDEQRVNLDGISGGTITTKAFLKAVENALSAKNKE